MAPGLFLVAAVAVVVGATLQRLSGTGVGLVVAPTLAAFMGPTVGVFLTNIASCRPQSSPSPSASASSGGGLPAC